MQNYSTEELIQQHKSKGIQVQRLVQAAGEGSFSILMQALTTDSFQIP